MSYSYKQRLNEIGKVKMNKQLKKYKNKTDIEKLEKKLIDTCKKSNKIEKFKEYLKVKMEIYENIVTLYEKSKSRKYKWYSYLNRRSQDNLIKRIKKEYGIDVSIFIGDWSNGNHQMKHFISTPRIGLKRKLKKHFKVYNLDEYKTSKMCYKTKEETKNLKVEIKDKEGKIMIKKLHPVLTYRMENNRIGCLNRDKNSCLNMLNIIETWKLKKEYPTYLKRSISNDNPLQCQLLLCDVYIKLYTSSVFIFSTILNCIGYNRYDTKKILNSNYTTVMEYPKPVIIKKKYERKVLSKINRYKILLKKNQCLIFNPFLQFHSFTGNKNSITQVHFFVLNKYSKFSNLIIPVENIDNKLKKLYNRNIYKIGRAHV